MLLSFRLDLYRFNYFFGYCPCFDHGQYHLLEYAQLNKLKYLWLQQEPYYLSEWLCYLLVGVQVVVSVAVAYIVFKFLDYQVGLLWRVPLSLLGEEN